MNMIAKMSAQELAETLEGHRFRIFMKTVAEPDGVMDGRIEFSSNGQRGAQPYVQIGAGVASFNVWYPEHEVVLSADPCATVDELIASIERYAPPWLGPEWLTKNRSRSTATARAPAPRP